MADASPSRIQSVHVRAVRVPMAQPHQTASGVITESPLVLTDVHTTDGIIGHSLVFTYTSAALHATAELIKQIAGLLQGEHLAPAALEQTLSARFRLLGTQGLVGMALAALDMALWDALARRCSTSLVGLLGGQPRALPVYGAVGYEGVAASARAAEAWARRGFTGVKAKIGYPSLQEDLAVVRAMREAVGDSVAIMVDYNQCLTPSEAVERLRVLDAEGLAWVEEPTLAHDFRGHALVAREVRTLIQCGENWWGALDVQHALDAHAADLLMLDVMKIGGVTGWLRAAALAQPRGMRISSHLWPEVSAQLLAVTPTAHWLEYADWWNPILQEPLEIRDGMTVSATRPGSGIDWNEAAISQLLG